MAKTKTAQEFKQDRRNANRGTDRGRAMVEASLREVGAGRSILSDRAGNIIAGNKTLAAAESMGLKLRVIETDGKELVVVQRNDLDLTDDTGPARKMAWLDNRASEVGLAWDAEVLLADLNNGLSFDGLFDKAELDALLAGLVTPEPVQDPGADISKADELQKKWKTESNQLWQLGEHKLLIGDSTDKESMGRLMGDERWNAIVTDPPYGVDYVGGRNPKSNTPRAKLQGDNNALLYYDFLNLWMEARADRGVVYMWFSGSVDKPVYDAAEAVGLTVRAMIVWNKLDAHYGNFMAQYMQKHEPCLYCAKGSTDWYGPTNEVTVWDIKQPTVNEFHPTEKPLECMERPVRNSTKQGDIVVDPFVGSGTTLLACERLGRKCRAIEINAGFAACVIQRWADATGQTPVLSGE